MRLATAWILPAIAGLYVIPACSGGVECDDVCPPDIQRCDGDTLQICATDLNGCRVWEEQDCSASDMTCEEENATTASCESGDDDTDDPTCDDECDTAGETRCERDTIEECRTDSDGCKSWELSEDCGSTDTQCVADGGDPVCMWDAPAIGNDVDLYTDTCEEDRTQPKTGDVECPADTTSDVIVDFYEIPGLKADDCVWVRGDNLGSANGSDIFLFIVQENGDYTFFDDEEPCSITGPYACPEGGVIAPSDKLYIAIGQWDGDGCDAGDQDSYQLFVSVNGDAETPVRVANDISWTVVP